MNECKKEARVNKGLLIESGGVSEDSIPNEEDIGYEEFHDNTLEEEIVFGDNGPLLVVRRACFAPRASEGEGWLRTNIFQSSCTIKEKVCKMIIDSGSCENVVSEAVTKLGLEIQTHPQPYKLSWLQKGSEVTVTKRVCVYFSIGNNYKDRVWCDVVAMDTCHILFARPWQFDRCVMHDGRKNTYSFVFNNIKITLVPTREQTPKPQGKNVTNLLSMGKFVEEAREMTCRIV